MSDTIQVCQIINSLGLGGAEHLLVDLADAIEGVEFTVVSISGEGTLARPLQDAGAHVQHLEEIFRFSPRTILSICQVLGRNDFDVVHTHLPYAQTIGRIAAHITNQHAVVSTQHNVPSNYHPVVRKTEQITRKWDDVTIAVSKGVERAFTGSAHEAYDFGDEWCTIYNGIDVDGHHDAVAAADCERIRSELGINDTASVFLNVGRYVKDKSQSKLIKAFDAAATPDAALVIVGHGPLETDLQKTAERLGIAEQVYVTGRVPEVEPYYALADVFVSSSRVEGLPVTLLEAMAAKLPVVASSIPGVNEVVIDGETGYLYPYSDIERLSALLTECTNMEKDNLGRAAYNRAESVFDRNVMAEAHLNLYQLVAEN